MLNITSFPSSSNNMLQATGRKWAYIMIRIIWYWLTNPIITVHVNNKLTTYVIHVIATEFRCNCLANKYPVGKHDRLQLRDTLQRKRTYYETTRLNEKKKINKMNSVEIVDKFRNVDSSTYHYFYDWYNNRQWNLIHGARLMFSCLRFLLARNVTNFNSSLTESFTSTRAWTRWKYNKYRLFQRFPQKETAFSIRSTGFLPWRFLTKHTSVFLSISFHLSILPFQPPPLPPRPSLAQPALSTKIYQAGN